MNSSALDKGDIVSVKDDQSLISMASSDQMGVDPWANVDKNKRGMSKEEIERGVAAAMDKLPDSVVKGIESDEPPKTIPIRRCMLFYVLLIVC